MSKKKEWWKRAPFRRRRIGWTAPEFTEQVSIVTPEEGAARKEAHQKALEAFERRMQAIPPNPPLDNPPAP